MNTAAEGRTPRGHGSFLLALVWVTVAITFPLAAWGGNASSEATPYLLKSLVTITLVYVSLRLGSILWRGEPRLVFGVFWLFLFVVAAAVPLAQIHTGRYPYLKSRSDLTYTQIIVLTFALTLDLGYTLLGSGKARRQPEFVVAHARLIRENLLVPLNIFALLASAYYVATVGGPAAFFLSRSDLANSLSAAGFRQGTQVGSAIIVAFGTIPIIFAFTLWTVRWIRQPRHRTLGGAIIWVVLLAANIIVNNPIANSRYWFLTVLIGFTYSLPHLGPRLYRFTLVGGVFAALLVFPYSDYFRNAAATRTGVVVGPVAETISTKDYDQIIMTANGVWYVGQYGHTFGEQLLGSALFWVPRSIWDDKPIDTGVLVGQYLNAGTANLSSPLWLEIWIDFGLVGVVVGGILIGLIIRRLDDSFIDIRCIRSSRLFVLQFLLPFLAGYSFILLRGSLLQSMSLFAVLLGIMFLLRGRRLVDQQRLEDEESARAGQADLATRAHRRLKHGAS